MRLPILAAALLLCATAQSASAKGYAETLLYSFCGEANCTDGSGPVSRLVMDGTGTLYGTTQYGGTNNGQTMCILGGCGTVFALVPNAGKTAWTHQVIHNFCKNTEYCRDGAEPSGDLIMDVNGNLYGVAYDGGTHGNGVVFELSPGTRHGHWHYRVLHDFCQYAGVHCRPGSLPRTGLTYAGATSGAPYDGVSPLYGVAASGGKFVGGTVYRLTPGSGVRWTADVLHTFDIFRSDGATPTQPLMVDKSGNLFGTTSRGGDNDEGTFFELRPSSSGWDYVQIYSLCPDSDCTDGNLPSSGLVPGASGKLYGTMAQGGANSSQHCSSGCGVFYALTPEGGPQKVRYDFCSKSDCADGATPTGTLAQDAAGNVYGATDIGGGNDGDQFAEGGGTVYMMNGGRQRVLYSFCAQSGCTDGAYPITGVTLDGAGDIFGTTSGGGAHFQGGAVYELVPQ